MSFGTGAGKGDLPRHVDGASYRNNYDLIFRKKPTQEPEEPKAEADEDSDDTPQNGD